MNHSNESFIRPITSMRRQTPKMDPRFSTVRPAIVFLIPNMLIFLESGGLGESSSALKILILGYGKKSDFRGGTPNLCIKARAKETNGTKFVQIPCLLGKLCISGRS